MRSSSLLALGGRTVVKTGLSQLNAMPRAAPAMAPVRRLASLGNRGTFLIRGGVSGRPSISGMRTSFIRRLGTEVSDAAAGQSLWQAFVTYPKRKPFPFQVAVATGKTSLADYLTQMYLEGNEEFDLRRNLVFVAFGGIYLGGFQWYIYVTKFRQWFPGMDAFATQSLKEKLANRPGQITLLKQVAFDNFVHYTFMYFPVFYILKELIQEREGGFNPLDLVRDGLSKYSENCVADNLAMWAIWIPCDVIIYAIPIWMRLPANHLISLCWCILLSFMRGKSHDMQHKQHELPSPDTPTLLASRDAEKPKKD